MTPTPLPLLPVQTHARAAAQTPSAAPGDSGNIAKTVIVHNVASISGITGARLPRPKSPGNPHQAPHETTLEVPHESAKIVPPDTGMTSRKGSCTLVGAGPGDPELLTLKALRAIQSASVLLVDDLVSDEIVALKSATARVVYVGKRGGCKSTPQSFIEKLMLMAVLEGENVVRLKGGDPFIFGRGGEECEALRAAGVQVQVVNGITAGVAAAGALLVPLTHREHAQGVIFLTGHAKLSSDASAPTDWAALATTAHAARLTLVIYMAVSGAERIQAGLLRGMPGDTPVAVVHNASLPQERQVLCVLSALHETLKSERISSPSVLVIGDVLRAALLAATLAKVPLQEQLQETNDTSNQASHQTARVGHSGHSSPAGQFSNPATNERAA